MIVGTSLHLGHRFGAWVTIGVLAAAAAAATLGIGAGPAMASSVEEFGVTTFTTAVTNAAGETYTQAGGHPYEASTTIHFNLAPIGGGSYGTPDGGLKDAFVDLPAGFVGNPQAVPQCPVFELASCPGDTQIGTATVSAKGVFRTPVYNIVPEKGLPAEFAFYANLRSDPVFLFPSVRPSTGYQLRISSLNTVQVDVQFVSLTFWGVPADPSHDAQRGQYCELGEVGGSENCSGGGEAGHAAEKPFLTNPTDCVAGPQTTTLRVDDWYEPAIFQTYTATSPVLTGCEALTFDPSLSVQPSTASEGGTTQADEPSGYTVNLAVPQDENPDDLATPELRDATVTLPAGVSVSPSAAEGLTGCQETGGEGINLTEEQINAAGVLAAVPGRCPAASTLGTVEVFTPLLADGPNESAPLNGHIYLARPRCGETGQPVCTQASATNGELYGLYLEAEGEGVIVKLKGTVAANASTGQLTGTFAENPQLPFNDLRLHFKGGPRAPLANPAWCGAATTTSSLSAWSEATPLASPSSIFDVDYNGTGGACPASVPFAPTLSAGSTSVAAGAFTPFTVSFTRGDRQQTFSQIAVATPAGLLGMVSKVPQCPEAQANAGNCSSASQIGTTTVAAGAGSHPFYVSGRVYLTGPYKGAPFGLSVVVPANAGPFHLGNVIVRAAISVDPNTATLTITSDPLPQIIDGVPLRLRTVNVTVNRPEFMLNPTSCTASSVGATIQGDQGARARVTSPFDVGGCASLPFKPRFSASTAGKASKAGGASLDVKVSSKGGPQARGEEANIRSVKVDLPKQLPSRLTTLQKACLAATFEGNPANCPKESDVGTATAATPILAHPLSGPAYLVSHGGAAFPDLEIVLQGEGITLILDGKTDIKKGITSSTFRTVPDAPISSFELKLPTGRYSILGTDLPAKAKYRLCGRTLKMPTAITGQNGVVVKQTTEIAVTGCPKAKRKNAKNPKKAGKATHVHIKERK